MKYFSQLYQQLFPYQCQHGQSMLEAIAAVTVITVGITGVMALTGNNLVVSSASSQQVVAINLAREAIEVVRNFRDSNWLAGDAWDNGFSYINIADHTAVLLFSPLTNEWTVDYSIDALSDDGAQMYRATTGLYRQFGSGIPDASYTPTSYRRLVTIDQICADSPDDIQSTGECSTTVIGYRVYVHVSWDESNGSTRSVDVEERFYNWK